MAELEKARLYISEDFSGEEPKEVPMVRGVYKEEGFSEKPLQRDSFGRKYIIVDGQYVYLDIKIEEAKK